MKLRRSLALGCVPMLLAVTAACTSEGEGAVAEGPNVLIILTDDQRDDITGMSRLEHWFVDGGTRFTNAFATTPLCCPSRASIFSGRYTHNHGVLTNTMPEELEQGQTLQRYLKRAGYRTGLVGKYLNTWPLEDAPPHFTDFTMFKEGYVDEDFNVDGEIKMISGYTTDVLAEKTTELLTEWERDDDRPWFLMVAPYGPHSPYRAADRYREEPLPVWEGNPSVEEQDRSDKPPYVQAEQRFQRGVRHAGYQIRNLKAVDDMVEDVMVHLGTEGERSDTLVFYLSDNGYLWGDHGLLGKGPPYAPSVKIPMFVRWPGHFDEGEDARLVANIDLAPTILDAAGIEPDEPMDGRSLLSDQSRGRLLLEYYEYKWNVPSWGSIWNGDHQYIEYYDDAGEVTFRELYDLRSDPWQLVNLLSTRPNDAIAQELAETLSQDRDCAGSDCP